MFDFSESLPRAKSSKLRHIFTSRLCEKKPEPSPDVSDMPISWKVLTVIRLRGSGVRSFLNSGNIPPGIAPRLDSCGGGWGGCDVEGVGCEGLKTKWITRPKPYESAADGLLLEARSDESHIKCRSYTSSRQTTRLT